MMMRLWTTGLRRERTEAYEAFARNGSLPMFRQQEGFIGVVMSHRGSVGQVLTIWRDAAAVDALSRSPSYRSTVEQILAADLLTGQQSTEVSEIHLCDLPALSMGEESTG